MGSQTASDVGQMLWVGFDGLVPPASLVRRARAGEIGAAILFRRNVESLEQVGALCAALHAAAPAGAPPPLVCVDQEGGRVQRVREPATVWPPMKRLGERAGQRPDAAAVELARAAGLAVGRELAALGFDLDFAPVLDVHTNPANPVIGDRAFATTPEAVAALAGAFARGLDEAGILSCGKHFPGHGDTALDSHLALPRIDHALERLRAIELAPFRALAAELPTLMTAHVVFAALDDRVPATLSERVLRDLLRGELGYRGVIVSDDLEMKAIADHFGVEDAAERAVRAGCDVLLLCHLEDLQLRVHEALVRAAERSSELRARIGEAAARLAALRARCAARPPRPGMDVVGCAAHRALVARLA